jgi:methyl-accepting chemotaxis protein WspA
MIRDWTIRQRILASFAVILALMIAMAVAAYTGLRHIRQEATLVETNSLYYATEISAAHCLGYALTQEYAMVMDPGRRQKQLSLIRDNAERVRALMARYETTINTPREREDFDAFKQHEATFSAVRDDIVTDAVNRKDQDVVTRVEAELDPAFEKSLAAIDLVVDGNKTADADAVRQITTAVSTAETGIALGFGAALFAALFCGYSLLRAITRPLGKLSTQLEQSGSLVNTSVDDIAASARQQEVMATEVATTTLEIGATSKEISATSKELVRTMSDVSRVADQSAALAGSGQTGLTQMEETMRQIIAAAGSVNGKLAVLNEKAANIGQVVTTITKVADQTNLLSLNAAIEAEKAGEYGRGFAVVATEIRRLADQTAVATYDIEQMVKEIQSAVSAGVMSMDKFSEEVRRGMQSIEQIGAQLSQIIQQVQALAPRVESVNEGMQAQTTGAEQISEALTQLSSAAQHTVESLRQSSQAIDGLQRASKTLSTGVASFKLKVA